MSGSIPQSHTARLFARAPGLALVLLCACSSDDGTAPSGVPNATLELIYATQAVGARLSQPDRIHITAQRTTGRTATDTILPFLPGGTDAHFQVAVHVQSTSEAFAVATELLEADLVVARGSQRVVISRGGITSDTVVVDHLRDNLALADSHACVLDELGEAYCWGRNGVGELGNGTTFGSSRPVKVSGGLRFVAIDVGTSHTCALTELGQAYCWGGNSGGTLGTGSTTPAREPVPVAGNLRFVQIGLGAGHSCGLTFDGEMYCWGDNGHGALAAAVNRTSLPVRAAGDMRFDGMQVGFLNTCGWSAGRSYCWGVYVGEGPTSRNVPARTGGFDFTGLAPGTLHNCGILAEGAAYCWGAADGTNYGQLGNGTMMRSDEPVPVAGNLVFRRITSSRANSYMAGHSCALGADGRAYCWGLARFGQLGNPASTSPNRCDWTYPNLDMPCTPHPVPVTGNHRFVALAAGNEVTCAMTSESRVYCWGYGGNGVIGRGDLDDRAGPTEIGTPISAASTAENLTIEVPRLTLSVGDSMLAVGVIRDQRGFLVPTGSFFQWFSVDTAKVAMRILPWPQGASPYRVMLYARARGPVFLETSSRGLRAWVDLVVN